MLGFLMHTAALVTLHAACSVVCFALIFIGTFLQHSSKHSKQILFSFAYLALKFITHI